MTSNRPPSRRVYGFTLTELAVVLVIVALLIGGLLMPLSAQDDLRRTTDTQKALREIQEALVGYAASHQATDRKPMLPCPDTDGNGIQDVAGGTCSNHEGRIPWVDLGVGMMDPWGNRFRYRVTPEYANRLVGFTLDTPGTLRVCADASCSTSLATALPAVVLSHGKNGAGAFNSSGGTNPAPTSANEAENTDGDSNFVSTTPAPDYDDIVVWLSPNLLFNRMISAGRLP